MMKNYQNKKSKKYLCAVCVFIFVLFEPVLLCGCASARDEVTLELGVQESTVDEKMTQVSEIDAEIESVPQQVYIYLCGAVALPGVYSLREGSRLYEAVELAGGLTGDADENCLNMARQIVDGEQVRILTLDEAAALREMGAYQYPAEANASSESSQRSGLVNINTATAEELTSVSGIGASRAQAIIDYREQNGRFGSIEDIKNVDGIKDGLFSKIKDKITI